MSADNPNLAALEAELARLKAQIASVGFITPGSVVRRYMPCGKPGCRCQGDPPKLHGPYWQWSRAKQGKTLSRRLSPEQANLYKEWIANRRALGRIIAEMEEVSAEAGDIILQDSGPQTRLRGSRRRRPQQGQGAA